MRLALYSLAFATGCVIPWVLPWLLPLWIVLPMALVTAIVSRGFERAAIILFLVGFGYGLHSANSSNLHQVADLPQGLDAIVEGRVLGLPDNQSGRSRFRFSVQSFELKDGSEVTHSPRQLRLSWYSPEVVTSGEVYRFEVRLRRPRGLVNPSQFDYRQWLLAEGIDATGYVRQNLGLLGPGKEFSFSSWREQQRALLEGSGLRQADLIAALGIGDRTGIEADQWQQFSENGIIHLMVISGLHLGFASFLGYRLGNWCARPLMPLLPGCKAQDFGWLSALLVALLYALCAGFSTPTLRAFIMIATFAIAQLLHLRLSVWTILSIAFAIVLLLEPLSVLSAGLWMSFGAVVVLVAAFQGRVRENKFLGLLRAQAVLFVGFSVLPLSFGNPVPLVAPLVNLFAVPLIGLIVVPVILLGLVAGIFGSSAQIAIWRLADSSLSLLLEVLQHLQSLSLPMLYPPEMGMWSYGLMAVLAITLVAVPMRARLWPLLLLGMLPLYAKKEDTYFLQIQAFDVGQGTAVLIRQLDYMLLYDTGPGFSQTFNAGRDILLPFLSRTSAPDRDLIVSHGDADHAGGAAAILESGWVNGRLLVGESLGIDPREERCVASQAWQIEGVTYRILHPDREYKSGENNDLSCVLLISFADQHILLPGDISRRVEQIILDDVPQNLAVLLAPHHGSATSSSLVFVEQTQPKTTLISSGYGNSFGHPVDAVVRRYLDSGSELLNTATAGAITLSWRDPYSEAEISLARDAAGLWWQE